MQFEQAYAFLIEKLENELPGYLHYHNAEHTKQVVKAVEHLAQLEKVPEADLKILYTAALFHDAGFLEGYNHHEELSCKVATTYLAKFEYTAEQIDRINKLIMSTKGPQLPSDQLEKILCDGDLYYLGTAQYFSNAERLFQELKAIGVVKNWNDWQKKETRFLSSHHYFTETANRECSQKKRQNLQEVKSSKGIDTYRETRFDMFFSLQDVLLTLFGVVFAGFALKGFLMPNNFFDGGLTGISLLVHEIYEWNLAYVILLINLPLVILSFFTVSRRFAIKTFIAVALLGICLLYVPYPIITSDKLLISFFGGFFLGIGIGLAMRAGCALDGIEVLALYTLKRTSFSISEIILAINILIFAIAAFKFGIETALYSILTYFTASKAIDYVVEGIEAYTGVTIISGHSEIIKHRLVNELGRAITIYKGERGYLPDNFEISDQCDIIFTVITRLELYKLKRVVHETDPKAFVFASTIREALGGIIKHRHVH